MTAIESDSDQTRVEQLTAIVLDLLVLAGVSEDVGSDMGSCEKVRHGWLKQGWAIRCLQEGQDIWSETCGGQQVRLCVGADAVETQPRLYTHQGRRENT